MDEEDEKDERERDRERTVKEKDEEEDDDADEKGTDERPSKDEEGVDLGLHVPYMYLTTYLTRLSQL